MLLDDIRNNSVWNQRFFVITQTSGWTGEVVSREVDYAWQKILSVKRNESAWNYLRGVLDHSEGQTLKDDVRVRCEELLQSGCDSPYLLGFLVELYKQQLEDDSNADKAELVTKVKSLCEQLAQEHDTVRCKYWNFISDSIVKKHSL